MTETEEKLEQYQIEVITDTEQFKTLMKIAKSKYDKMMKKVGVPIEGEPNEKFLLYCSYPEDKMIRKSETYGSWWDIPRYTNGTTRHAKTLFRVTPKTCIGGGYCARVSSLSKYEPLRQESEYEKLLMTEDIHGYKVDIVWTWYWAEWSKSALEHGAYYISVGDFFIETRILGQTVQKIKVKKAPGY